MQGVLWECIPCMCRCRLWWLRGVLSSFYPHNNVCTGEFLPGGWLADIREMTRSRRCCFLWSLPLPPSHTWSVTIPTPVCLLTPLCGCPAQLVAPLCRVPLLNATSSRLSWDHEILGWDGRGAISKKIHHLTEWFCMGEKQKCLLHQVTDNAQELNLQPQQMAFWGPYRGDVITKEVSVTVCLIASLKTERWASHCVCSSLSWQLSQRKVCIRSFGLPAAEC